MQIKHYRNVHAIFEAIHSELKPDPFAGILMSMYNYKTCTVFWDYYFLSFETHRSPKFKLEEGVLREEEEIMMSLAHRWCRASTCEGELVVVNSMIF